MGDEKMSGEEVFISYLDEENGKREGYFKVKHFDASFCKFETKHNTIIIPTCRILKIKYKKEGENESAPKRS